MNILTDVRKALVERLATITVANGYRTNVGGSVESGWFNEVVKDGQVTAGGMVVVQKAKGMVPQKGPLALKMFPGFHVIGAVSAGLDAYEDAIEDIELDLLRCLMPAHGEAMDWLPTGAPTLTVGSPEPFPPGKGLPAATVLIPIHITTFVEA